MRVRPKTRVQFYQILAITIFWVLCGAFFAIYKCVTYDPLSGEFVFIVPQGKTLGGFILTNMIGPAIGGIVGGSVLILILNDRLRNKSYGRFLLVNMIFFFVMIFTLNTAVSYTFYYNQEISQSVDPWHAAVRYLILDPYAIRNIVTWMLIAFATTFAVRIYEKYGPGTFIGLLIGEYHRAHEVERVFMFLDLTDSTAIAEKIGHVAFFNLLRDFYADITDPVLNSHGEIHQYVGDEVVVTWDMKKAVTDRPNCLECFARIENAIHQRLEHYREHYGIDPVFKAAVHMGTVVVGEMGIIKREIVYSGDTLNTTARMLEQCKIYDQRLIASQEVLDLLSPAQRTQIQIQHLGEMVLRGKVQSVNLFGVVQEVRPSAW